MPFASYCEAIIDDLDGPGFDVVLDKAESLAKTMSIQEAVFLALRGRNWSVSAQEAVRKYWLSPGKQVSRAFYLSLAEGIAIEKLFLEWEDSGRSEELRQLERIAGLPEDYPRCRSLVRHWLEELNQACGAEMVNREDAARKANNTPENSSSSP